MKAEHGMDLPRRLQIEFSRCIKVITETSGTEITPRDVGRVAAEYFRRNPDEAGGLRNLLGCDGVVVRASLASGTSPAPVSGHGNGPSRRWSTPSAGTSALRWTCSTTPSMPGRRRGSHGVAYVELRSHKDVRWASGWTRTSPRPR